MYVSIKSVRENIEGKRIICIQINAKLKQASKYKWWLYPTIVTSESFLNRNSFNNSCSTSSHTVIKGCDFDSH